MQAIEPNRAIGPGPGVLTKGSGQVSVLNGGRQFVDRPPGLVDRAVRVRIRAGIGVGDGDVAEALTTNELRARLHVPGRVLQVEMVAGIAVWPAVDGDGEDVTRGIEAA